jgi:hypothetical protein
MSSILTAIRVPLLAVTAVAASTSLPAADCGALLERFNSALAARSLPEAKAIEAQVAADAACGERLAEVQRGRAKNQGSMRPGARKRDIEVVASRLGLETAFPGRTGASVQSDPVSESAFLTDKAASGDASIVGAVGPFPANKKAHARVFFLSSFSTIPITWEGSADEAGELNRQSACWNIPGWDEQHAFSIRCGSIPT